MRRIGDVSRKRRFADPVRQQWYAQHRARRFARRCFNQALPPPDEQAQRVTQKEGECTVTETQRAALRLQHTARAGGGTGSSPTWEELLGHRDGPIRLLMFGMHLTPEAAEDVTSDVLLEAKVRGGIRNLPAWLNRAAVVGGIDLIRQRQRWEEHKERIARSQERVSIDPAAEAERRDLIELVQRAIAALPERRRRPFQAQAKRCRSRGSRRAVAGLA